MLITLNGESRDIGSSATLSGMLEILELDPDTVILERNGEIVPRDRVHETPLEENDTLEVIRFVGGG